MSGFSGGSFEEACAFAKQLSPSTTDQLRVIRGTDVLIGTHGAGLVWNLFLPPGAPLIELLNRRNANELRARGLDPGTFG